MSYFEKSTLRVTISGEFDAKRVKATLDELAKWDGNWPTLADATTLRVALAHAKSAAMARRLREWTDRDPALHLEFLRLVSDKHWAKAVSTYDALTGVMAIVRGIPAPKKDPRPAIELDAAAEGLTDAELAAVFAALVDGEDRELRVRSDALARRLAALATTEAQVVRLYRSAGFLPTRLVRAMGDAQVERLFEWAIATERAIRTRGADYVFTGLQGLWFDLLRRGVVDEGRLAAYHEVLEAGRPNAVLREWIAVPRGGTGLAELTVEDDARGVGDMHRHAAAHAPAVRAYVQRHAARLYPIDAWDEAVLVLFAIAWGEEVAPLLTKLWAATADTMAKDYEQTEAGRRLAAALTGCPHADAILAAIAGATNEPRIAEVLAQARNELANRHALLGDGREEIDWGRTREADALELLARFSEPMAAIERGLGASEPLAVLNAWAIAAAFAARGGAGLSPARHGEVLTRLEQIYGPEAPDGDELTRRVGVNLSAAKLFDQAFRPLVGEDELWAIIKSLYRATTNARFKQWIDPYIELYAPELYEDVPTRLARLVAAVEGSPAGTTVTRHVLVRTAGAPEATAINRLFGPPIGVDARRWPKRGEARMMHVITLEARLLSEAARAALGEGCAAIAVFVDRIDWVERAEVLRLTRAQLAKGAAASEGEGPVARGFALAVLTAAVPAAVFADGPKTGAIHELRQLFDRLDLIAPGSEPAWIQEPEELGTFLFDLGRSFAGELNLGDNGRLYVFDEGALVQSY